MGGVSMNEVVHGRAQRLTCGSGLQAFQEYPPSLPPRRTCATLMPPD